jgi:hypothetical protein
MTHEPVPPASAVRRVVLIDPSETEAGAIPAVTAMPGVHLCLVACDHPAAPGVRAAERAGVRVTLDLADLTRDVYDVALLGEHSPRRARLLGLMRALGTPVTTPHEFTDGTQRAAMTPGALRESTVATPADGGAPSAIDPPPADDPGAIEAWLGALARRTGAHGARLVRGGPRPRVIAHVGDADPLLESLASRALRQDHPQVMTGLHGDASGRSFGGWPVRTPYFHGALAAAGFDPGRGSAGWEHAARELVAAWTARPARGEHSRCPWLDTEAFRDRVGAAASLGLAADERYSLYRLRFEGDSALVDHLCRRLPERMRGGDALCRPFPDQVLMLCSGSPADFVHIRRRVGELWEDVCSGQGAEPLLVTDERIEMAWSGDTDLFIAAAAGWLERR